MNMFKKTPDIIRKHGTVITPELIEAIKACGELKRARLIAFISAKRTTEEAYLADTVIEETARDLDISAFPLDWCKYFTLYYSLRLGFDQRYYEVFDSAPTASFYRPPFRENERLAGVDYCLLHAFDEYLDSIYEVVSVPLCGDIPVSAIVKHFSEDTYAIMFYEWAEIEGDDGE